MFIIIWSTYYISGWILEFDDILEINRKLSFSQRTLIGGSPASTLTKEIYPRLRNASYKNDIIVYKKGYTDWLQSRIGEIINTNTVFDVLYLVLRENTS